MVAHTLRLTKLQRDVGPAILIPVNNPLERIMRVIRRRTRVVWVPFQAASHV
jgi:hypothetical protein